MSPLRAARWQLPQQRRRGLSITIAALEARAGTRRPRHQTRHTCAPCSSTSLADTLLSQVEGCTSAVPAPPSGFGLLLLGCCNADTPLPRQSRRRARHSDLCRMTAEAVRVHNAMCVVFLKHSANVPLSTAMSASSNAHQARHATMVVMSVASSGDSRAVHLQVRCRGPPAWSVPEGETMTAKARPLLGTLPT